MTDLQRALYQFAQETRIPSLVRGEEKELRDNQKMVRAAREISRRYSGAILIKGGHLTQDAADLLYRDGQALSFRSARVQARSTPGAGCTLSSAIARGLGAGYDQEESDRPAKDLVPGALAAGLDLGRGPGPVDHTYRL